MRCKRKGFDYCFGLLLAMPWYVSVLLGEFVFVSCKWILPAFSPEHSAFHPVALALSEMAWLFSGIFMIIGVFIFAAHKKHWHHALPSAEMYPDR